MSNSLAIAAVTATLQSIITQGLKSTFSGLSVTILPLDKARPSGASTPPQVNLFLYQVARNAAWSNADMPRQNLPGELSVPPLPLNLYYLLTTYGKDDDVTEPGGHELLGKAMSVLYDHPVLSADDIKNACSALLPDADLDSQFEKVRITQHLISTDELSKLWTGFATQYRLSVAYEVGVALIESTRASAAPLPILTRGQGDSGISSQTGLTPVVPTLESIDAPLSQSAAVLSDTITLNGFHLNGTHLHVVFSHPQLPAPILRPPLAGSTDKQITVQIPNQPADWPPGFYNVSVTVRSPGENFDRTTNQLVLPLAPKIAIAPNHTAAGAVAITVTSVPDVWLGQRVTLLLGDQELPFTLTAAKTNSFTFPGVTLVPGVYYVRLRVDGVDSLLVDRSVNPPIYRPSQRIVVT